MAQGLIAKVKNVSGATIEAGKVVYASGVDESTQLLTIELSSNDDTDTLPAVGVTIAELADDATGSIRTAGIVAGIDTSEVETGSDVFVGQDGDLIFAEPTDSGLQSQQLGVVVSTSTNGLIYLFPMELRKLRTHAATHAEDGSDELSHGDLPDLDEDHHTQYVRADGTRGFTAPFNAGQDVTVEDLSANGDLNVGGETISQGRVRSIAGFVLPSMTEGERDLLTPLTGLMILNSTTGKINFYDGVAWQAVTSV